MPLKVAIVPVTPFQQNCSIIWDDRTMEAAVVDPGGDVPVILNALKELKVKATKIWITHGHLDHVGGAAELAAALGITEIEGPHEADRMLIANVEKQAEKFGVPGLKGVEPTRWLNEGDTVSIGAITFEVFHVPGHAPGHVVFVDRADDFALVGDTIFQGSVGRTDLPGCDHDLLISSIKSKLFTLGDEMTVLPGHGPATTIGRERLSNPFLT
jgi:glyoxylase-like metal-dependent hydrolase (beta-lactamase superfamily II)